MAVLSTRRDTPTGALPAPHLRDLVALASDAIYAFDVQGLLLSANPATAELLGVPMRELIGRRTIGFIDPVDHAHVERHIRAVFSGEQRRYECTVLRTDGARRLISVANSPVIEDGEVRAVLGVARDVTEERAQAAALERAEARYARLVDAASDSIATLDEEGNLTSVNRALEAAVGKRREELIGTHFVELLDPLERTKMWHMFAATLAGERLRRELHYTYPDGSVGISTVLSAPIVERGRVTGVLAIMRDVTEERHLVEQVVRREKLAALGELVGGVAHEINTPLTGILAFAQLLRAQAALDDNGKQAADTIVTEAKRAARIVGKLLTFARQTPPERLPTDINQVLQDTIELRRFALRTSGILLDIELDPKLPGTWADPSQLQQVFLNLLANAEQAVIDAGGDRRITVRTRREGDLLVAAIGDSGRGIAPEHLPYIFNPFYTTKPRGIGTGLGLSISDGIIREHGGNLRVRSEPGQGALFEVLLPRLSPPATDPV